MLVSKSVTAEHADAFDRETIAAAISFGFRFTQKQCDKRGSIEDHRSMGKSIGTVGENFIRGSSIKLRKSRALSTNAQDLFFEARRPRSLRALEAFSERNDDRLGDPFARAGGKLTREAVCLGVLYAQGHV